MRHVAQTCSKSLEHLYTTIGWPLYKKYGHAYDALKRSVAEADIFDGLDIPEDIMKSLLLNIKRRLAPQVRPTPFCVFRFKCCVRVLCTFQTAELVVLAHVTAIAPGVC